MVVLNYTGEEINAKIVYYGPGLSGKTTNLEYLYSQMPADSKGQMVSMKTRTDRTLFFDFFPLELGEICGYRTRFLLYTVPGQVYYNATRKLVLKGADAGVFVADSARDKLQENIESLRNLEDNLNEHGLSLDNIPWIIQYNKRDLPDPMPIAELHQHLNLMNVPAFEAIALTGFGVYDTFKSIASILYRGEAIGSKGEGAGVGGPAGPGSKNEDVTDAVDVALREVDSSGAQKAQTGDAGRVDAPVPILPPSPPSPQPEPVPPVPPTGGAEAAPGQGEPASDRPTTPITPEDWGSIPPQPQPVPEQPSPSVEVGMATEPSSPIASPTGQPTVEATNDSFSFQTEDEGLSPDVGRLVELDESAEPSEVIVQEETPDFITDPMRSSPTPEPVAEIEPEEAPVVTERKVEMHEQELTVPVVISRSQVRKTIPLRLRLEIRVVDD
jgi:signal recognition particle receptor subunit beta